MKNVIILLLLALIAFLGWYFLPGTSIDRAAFFLTSRSIANPPFFITGEGTHEAPHTLRTLRSFAAGVPEDLPVVISLGDDPEGFFQASPPSPVDFAIILRNLRRLGQDRVALATPLSWPEADAISLTALDQQLDAMSSAITSSPLSRSPLPTPIPPAFRRASIALSEVDGNTSLLPIVNRLSIPDVVLGKQTPLAGFTILESEPATTQLHLLARWDDRVVLSLHLLTALSHLQVSPEDIFVRLGEFIALGEDGPHILIDPYGRLATATPALLEKRTVPAPELIDAPDDFFPESTFAPVIVRNDLSSADAPTAAFSKLLVGTFSVLADPQSSSTSRTFPRLPRPVEFLLLGALALLLAALSSHPFFRGKFAFLLLIGLLIALHFALIPITNTWLPTLPAFAIAIASGIVTFFTKPRTQAPAEAPANPATPPVHPKTPPPTAQPPPREAIAETPAPARKASE